MSTLNTVPLLGRHTTTITITPQSVSAAGVFTAQTPFSVLAQIEMIGLDEDPEVEEINALSTTRRNEVIISDGYSLSVQIYKINNGSDPNPLWTAIQSYDYYSVSWVEGTVSGGGIQTVTFWGHRGKFSTGAQGRGKQIASLDLGPIDIGTAQVTRVLS